MTKFDSGDDRRVENSPDVAGYTGPDDVALSYRALSDDDKQLMRDFKVDCQSLINDVREQLGNCAPGTVSQTHPELERAITHIIDASANITRFITRFRTEYNKPFEEFAADKAEEAAIEAQVAKTGTDEG